MIEKISTPTSAITLTALELSLYNSRPAFFTLVGISAAVVGILLAALYDPLWTTAILTATDFALALLLFIMLVHWRLPPWIVVVAGTIGGALLEYL